MPTIPGASADNTSNEQGAAMPKAYIVTTYRSISNPDTLAEYAKLAGPAMIAAGGRFLARGNAAKAYEKGVVQRVVLIEFDSVEKAVAAHDGPVSGRIEGFGQRRRARHSHRRSAGIIGRLSPLCGGKADIPQTHSNVRF
jgi:uncharacterized protein (DUF1330 family)